MPQRYENAKTALAECSRIDECKDWADKAEALASYARQAGDDALRKLADRIQARATRRCGELLKQIRPATGAHRKRVGANPLSRKGAAREAGLSDGQRKTALRVAAVPADKFEAEVESDDPPTVTKLAQMGTNSRGFKQATQLIGAVRRFAEFCQAQDPAEVAAGVTAREAKDVRKKVAIIDAWLDRFVVSLKE